MKIQVTIDPGSGFCFGVVNAIKKAEEALENNESIYCVGQIVHNDEEMLRLESKGLITIEQDGLLAIENSKVLFRAHGEPRESYVNARANNNIIIDASCPIILRLQDKIRRSFEQGDFILIYGKHKHPETIGLASQTNNTAVVFEKKEELELAKLPQNLTIFSQTTMSLDDYIEVTNYLYERGFKLKINDTICRQVANRRENLSAFSKEYAKIVFIAGRNSSNGKVLFSICKEANPNTFFISSAEELKREWFVENDTVGIAGATSTPKWLMEKVKQEIESW